MSKDDAIVLVITDSVAIDVRKDELHMPEEKNPVTFVKGVLAKHYFKKAEHALKEMDKAHKNGDFERSASCYQRYLKYVRLRARFI